MQVADTICIDSGALQAWVHPLGAELYALRTAGGHDLVWPGDPRWWSRSAPILFPIIGRPHNGEVLHQGRRFPMQPHGFAMHERFDLLHSDAQMCGWRLAASPQTRFRYPFEFDLELVYRVDGCRLTVDARVRNSGDAILPFSFGFHPGLCWPIRGPGRAGHSLHFESPEPGLAGIDMAAPFDGRKILLDDRLFVGGARVLERLTSRRVVYADPDGPLLSMAWTGMAQLALWTLPSAPFLCVEPWAGLPDQPGAGSVELLDKPGTQLLHPGHQALFSMEIVADPSLGVGVAAAH